MFLLHNFDAIVLPHFSIVRLFPGTKVTGVHDLEFTILLYRTMFKDVL